MELRWGQRIAGLPVMDRESMPAGPMNALFDLHLQAIQTFRTLLDDRSRDWKAKVALDLP